MRNCLKLKRRKHAGAEQGKQHIMRFNADLYSFSDSLQSVLRRRQWHNWS